MIKDELLKNALKLHLDTHKEVLDKLEADWSLVEKELENLRKIDISNVKPLVRPVEQTTTFLREDLPGNAASKKTVLTNAPHANDDYILVNKGGEHD